ncbi:hypothetical protein ACTFIY_009090 [Dictyostelium cf. discoideum]
MVKNKIYFDENDPQSTDISIVFEYIEISGENEGNFTEVKRRIIKYFAGTALVTFIQKSKAVNNYNDIKRELVRRYDIRKLYKPEDELTKLSDRKFDKFIKYITSFESLNAQVEPALTRERQIELFIRGISDNEIKKAIDEANPTDLDDAISVARRKANSKYKYDGLEFYNAGYINKFIERNQVESTQPQLPQLIQPIQTFQEQIVKQEHNLYATNKKPQFMKYDNNKCFKCGKTGHFANQCNEEEINTIIEQVTFTTNQEDLKRVSLYGVLLVNDQPTRCLIDTGSTITMIHESFANHLDVKLESCSNELKAANGSKINIKGKTSLTIAIGNIKRTIDNVYVTNHFNFKCLLGINTLKMIKANIDICNEKLTSGGNSINLFTFGKIPIVKNEALDSNQGTYICHQIPFHTFLGENVNTVSIVKKKMEINNSSNKKEEKEEAKECTKVVEEHLSSNEGLDETKDNKEDVKEEINKALIELEYQKEEHKQLVSLENNHPDTSTNKMSITPSSDLSTLQDETTSTQLSKLLVWNHIRQNTMVNKQKSLTINKENKRKLNPHSIAIQEFADRNQKIVQFKQKRNNVNSRKHSQGTSLSIEFQPDRGGQPITEIQLLKITNCR